jgi:UDP-2,3-diacylglucosamine pyrophosphatase LpxH
MVKHLLDGVARHVVVDHPRPDGVPELVRGHAHRAAGRVANLAGR